MKLLSNGQAKSLGKRFPFYVCLLISLYLAFFTGFKVFAFTSPTMPTNFTGNLSTSTRFFMTQNVTTPTNLSLFYVDSDLIWYQRYATYDNYKVVTNSAYDMYSSTNGGNTWSITSHGVLGAQSFNIQDANPVVAANIIFTGGANPYVIPKDINYTNYLSNNYTGLLITNPYKGNITTSTSDFIVHGRIPVDNPDTVINDVNKIINFQLDLQDISDIKQHLIDNFRIYNNGYNVQPLINITMGKWEEPLAINGYKGAYNFTVNFKLSNFTSGANKIKVTTKALDGANKAYIFKTVDGYKNYLGSNIYTIYSNEVSYNYVPFVPVVTKVVDGNVTTTTTTQPTGTPIIEVITINTDNSITTTTTYDGYTDTETVDPNGNVTKTTDKPPVIEPIETDSPSGFFGSLLTLLGNVFKILLLPLTLVVNIINTLISSLSALITNMGQVVPFLSGVFGFLPTPVIGLITACFSFLAIGVFLRTFGRK